MIYYCNNCQSIIVVINLSRDNPLFCTQKKNYTNTIFCVRILFHGVVLITYMRKEWLISTARVLWLIKFWYEIRITKLSLEQFTSHQIVIIRIRFACVATIFAHNFLKMELWHEKLLKLWLLKNIASRE